jgi:hypothetical protein
MTDPYRRYEFSSGILAFLAKLAISLIGGWIFTFFLFSRLSIVRTYIRGDGLWILAAGCSLVIFILLYKD